MGFFDDDRSYLTQEEINYCQRLNETLDAHRASAELDKCSYGKTISFFRKWNQRKQKQDSESEKTK